MKDVIDSKSERMDIATFDAIHTVKYSLRQQVIVGSYLFTLACILHVVNTPNFRIIQRKFPKIIKSYLKRDISHGWITLVKY